MTDKLHSGKKGIAEGIIALISSLLVLLAYVPQDHAIYGSITIGVVVAILKTLVDMVKHRND